MMIRVLARFAVFAAVTVGGCLLLSGFLFFGGTRTLPVPACQPARVEIPDHPIELERILAEARASHQQITLSGAGYSQGGQTCDRRAIQIDTREMNQLIDLDLERYEVTVQAGITWRRLQDRLGIFGLSVSAMQSYADFSVGGSIGVNAHGQDVHWNPLSRSIVSMRILLTDGRHLFTSREENPELFRAVIGSYGLVGIVTEATLKVVPNTMLRKQVKLISARNYNSYFADLAKNPDLALHSARLSINPFYLFRNAVVVNYFDTGEPVTPKHESSSTPPPDASYLNLVKKSWLARTARTTVEYFWAENEGQVARNQAMGESVTTLTNSLTGTRDILQEYFLPPEQLQSFIDELKAWQKRHAHFTLINATIRQVRADQDSLLPYAPEPRVAVVLFINHPGNATADQLMGKATRELIDTTLNLGGRYYLPYALYASQTQFERAYPEYRKLVAARKKWDKANLLTNQIDKTYLQ